MTRRTKTLPLALPTALLLLIAVTVSLVHLGSPASAGAKTPPPAGGDRPINSLADLNSAFVDLAENVNPTVVTVFTEKVLRVRQTQLPFFEGPFAEFFGRRRPNSGQAQPRDRELRQQGLGSGVVVSADGTIITNNHVVDGADEINVRLMDDRTLPAEVVGTDPKTDIAVLKVDAEDLPYISLGDSDALRVGEMVLAIGSPLSANLAHTVTSGIVSAKGRSNVGLADYEDFIQTDAAINPGNSGGALINLNGELVGINTAIASRSGGNQGIGFAVPSNMAGRVMRSLIEHGSVVRGWLGVSIQDIDATLAAAMHVEAGEGVLVAEVVEDSPAAAAGLRQGDVLLTLDDEPIADTVHLRNEIAGRAPGARVEIRYLRDGERDTAKVKLTEMPTGAVAADVSDRLEEQFGFAVDLLTAELAGDYNLDRRLEGVVITAVTPGGAAQRAGLREGDLIVEINRRPTRDLESFNALIRGAKEGDTLLLRVVRANRSFYVGLEP